MSRFQTARLTVSKWDSALADPAGRQRIETALPGLLTPAVVRHLPDSVQLNGTADQIGDWITQRRGHMDVWLVERLDQLIGLLFLFGSNDSDAPTRHFGYLFAEQAWGQGYATELVQGLVDFLDHGDPLTLRAGVALGNPASAGVLTKSGFVPLPTPDGSETLQFQRVLPSAPVSKTS